MKNNQEYLAIKTGSTFTLVTVDHDSNQCTVDLADRQAGGAHSLCVGGTGERSIKRAAKDGAGRSYRTLKALTEDATEREMNVERRRDLDC